MKTATIIAMTFLSIQANGACQLTVAGDEHSLNHIWVFEQTNRFKPEKMDWVIFCLQEPLAESQRDPDKINSGINFNDLYGIKVVMEPQTQKISEVRLSWHENTIAMISGVLGNVSFNGEIISNHINGDMQSTEPLSAQQSTLINDEMVSENRVWGFSIQLDHQVQMNQ
ncbi:hypothetical protein [Marinicella meishanensis]|uniref:hypothetical protein n=1 Tax=Marinicella meishanensis TaxID=2873263 RepID=UPI001CBAEEE6|nr:hypothetical protein [Marinicella sp. NBU2979]